MISLFNPYILIEDHSYDGKHITGIIDLTDKWIGVRKFFLYWALQVWWIDYNMCEQRTNEEVVKEIVFWSDGKIDKYIEKEFRVDCAWVKILSR